MKDLIIRTEPRANETNFQPNYFPYVEFLQADFPWRFTPAKYKDPSSLTRLTPWLCLITLRKEEFEVVPSNNPLPIIRILNTETSLPDLDQYWAWAHCQINGKINNSFELKNILISQPHKIISRIISHRRLEPNTKYFAFLIPSFKVGVFTGLGHTIDNNMLGTEFAWKINEPQKNYELPIYYQWEFTTGFEGDFETLARKLNGIELGPKVGLIDIDVTDPLPISDKKSHPVKLNEPLKMGSVLWSPAAAYAYKQSKQIDVINPSPGSIRNFVMRLKELLDLKEKLLLSYVNKNRNIQNQDPVITPPIYGKWHSNKRIISRISSDYQEPDWIRELANTFPEIVTQIKDLKNDPPYLWLEELNLDPANRIAAGLGRLVIQDLQQELMEAAWDQVGQINEANMRLRVAQMGRTISKNIFDKTLDKMDPDLVVQFTSPFHSKIKVFNPLNRPDRPRLETVSRWLDEKSFIPKEFFSPSFKRIIAKQGKINRRLFGEDTIGISDNLLTQFNNNNNKLGLNEDPHTELYKKAVKPDRIITIGEVFDIFEIPIPENLEKTIPPRDSRIPSSEEEEDESLVKVDILADRIKKALDPEKVIEKKIWKNIDFDNKNLDKLDPILAYPKFKSPMVEPLRDMFEELFLAGIEDIQENTVSILQVNNSFVNSYMVGLNHEMARELLWNEYPTDLRGTYFRQF